VKYFFSIPCLVTIFLSCPLIAQTNLVSDSPIELINPPERAETVAKKPTIKCTISVAFDPKKLLVLLDGTDITGLLNITPEGFEYKHIMVLPPGSHTLSVTAYTADGMELKREFTFSTRHSKPLEEVYSNNEVTTLYEKTTYRDKDLVNLPSWKFESNLASESKLKEKGWEFKFNTNVRYSNQNLPIAPPLEKGFNLANYLFQGKYTGNKFSAQSEMGDIQINETPNTVYGLARRGGDFLFQFRDFFFLQLRTFVTRSEQLTGFEGGTGIGTTPDDHIMGASGDIRFFSDQLKFRSIYVKGGEEESSFGISTTGGAKKGDVWGFLFMTDFFKQKLTSEAEFNLSRFDADTTDEFSSEKDKAYRLKAGGTLGTYNYEAIYEYMGPDYEVVGNQGLQKNREGLMLKTGANFKIHTLNLSVSRYNDNVNEDDLFPRIYNYQGLIDYAFNKFPSLPLGISYQKSIQDSAMEPLGTLPIRIDTDMVSGRINYIKEPFNFGFQTSYSFQNDKTPQDNDTTTVTCTLTPTYTSDYLSISPSFSFNRSKSHLTEIYTDTYTTTLDLRGGLFQKKLTYGLAGTYSWIRASDGTTRQDTINGNFNVSYLLFKNLWGFLNPSMGIRGLYNKTYDRVIGQEHHELAIFLVISTSMPFSF